MKKTTSLLLLLTMVLMLVVVPSAAIAKGPGEIQVDGASVSAQVEKLKGNQNRLWITVTEAQGSVPLTESFMIANNAAGTYKVGAYEVYVDTKGNTQIRECYFVSYEPIIDEPDILLTASQTEFLTQEAPETVYFYAEVGGENAVVTLLDTENAVIAEMKDDGQYEESGDDIQNDGVYSCKVNTDLSAEVTLAYHAVSLLNAVSSVSNDVVIYIIAELTEEELLAMETADAAVSEGLNSSGYKSAAIDVRREIMNSILLELADQGLIIKESLYYDEGSSAFTFAYACGILGGVMIKDLGDEYDSAAGKAADRRAEEGAGSVPASVNAAAVADADTDSGIGKAIILNAFENTPFRRDYYPGVKADWDSKGLQTTVNTNVTVSSVKNLKGYDVIWFAGHGAAEYTHKYGFLWLQSVTDTIWLLNEKYTSATDKAYSIDLKLNRIIHINANLGKAYAMFPSLISSSYGAKDFSDSFIIFNACEIMGKEGRISATVTNVFLNRSAKSFISYHNSVYSVYGRELLKVYVDQLIEGKTAKEAFDQAKAQRGANDGGSPAAYPLLRGDDNATLVNSTIKNGSYELASTPQYWDTAGDVRVVTKLGELLPAHESRLALVSTGIGSAKGNVTVFYDGTQGSYMQQTVKLSNAVTALTFDYNVVSEEPPEYIGSSYNDAFIVELLDVNGSVLTRIVDESVNHSSWLMNAPLSGFKLSVGVTSGRPPYQLGWKSVTFDLEPYRDQVVTLRFVAFDRGDQAYDTVGLVDNVAIK